MIQVVCVKVRGNTTFFSDATGTLQIGDDVIVPYGDGFARGAVAGLSFIVGPGGQKVPIELGPAVAA